MSAAAAFPFAEHRTLAEVEAGETVADATAAPRDYREVARIVVDRMAGGASATQVAEEVGRDPQSVKGIWSAHRRRQYDRQWSDGRDARMRANRTVKETLAEWRANAAAVIEGRML